MYHTLVAVSMIRNPTVSLVILRPANYMFGSGFDGSDSPEDPRVKELR